MLFKMVTLAMETNSRIALASLKGEFLIRELIINGFFCFYRQAKTELFR